MKKVPDYITPTKLESYANEFQSASVDDFYFEDEPEDANEKVTAFVKSPNEMSRELLEEIAFLINKIGHYRDNKTGKNIGPDTIDRLAESKVIGYVLNENNLVIAAVTLVDTTEEGWVGTIPRNYYELKAGKSLANRLERRLFSIDEDYVGTNVGVELERVIQDRTKDIYAVSVLDKVEDTKFLLQNGYELISEFHSDITDNYLGLWIIEE